MKPATLSLIALLTFIVVDNQAEAKSPELFSEQQFQAAVEQFSNQVEDLRSLRVNKGKENAPISVLKDQSLDGRPKDAGLPNWFIEWHAASAGGKDPQSPKALAIKRMLIGAPVGEAKADTELTSFIKRFIDTGSHLGPRAIDCEGPPGGCATIVFRDVASDRMLIRKNPSSAARSGAGKAQAAGAGTGMTPTLEGESAK